MVNPAQIKHFARTKLGRNKTDKLDAGLIAEYCRLFVPAPWTPPSPVLRRLRDLVRMRADLVATLTDWTKRRAAGCHAAEATVAANTIIAQLEYEVAAIEAVIRHALDDTDEMRHRRDLLVSIPGIGAITAAVILTELLGPDVLRRARNAAAYAGLQRNSCGFGQRGDLN